MRTLPTARQRVRLIGFLHDPVDELFVRPSASFISPGVFRRWVAYVKHVAENPLDHARLVHVCSPLMPSQESYGNKHCVAARNDWRLGERVECQRNIAYVASDKGLVRGSHGGTL